MVAASRREQPPVIDVRYAVRARLESLLRKGDLFDEVEPDWEAVLIRFFKPGFVKLGVATAFVCMLVLAGKTIIPDYEVESQYGDPLVTLNSAQEEAEWSDWL
ncbi:MAG: hypothetical protein KJT03_12785 [Verrucomicrobiae bacterium]|nr:hypothetical protein [Verrucomicrobiae bacterium]